jgi:hypothetical protein
MLRVSFSSMTTARAARDVLEAYGYSARQFDRDIVTDCPTLLAVPVIPKRVGFAEIDRLALPARSPLVCRGRFPIRATPREPNRAPGDLGGVARRDCDRPAAAVAPEAAAQRVRRASRERRAPAAREPEA